MDEPRERDLIFHDRDITYVINKELLEKAKPILVDFATTARGSGLKISSKLKAEENCGPSCGC